MSGKTIVAPASAPGRGGVSVIRMSGAGSKEIAQNMCGSLADSWKFKKSIYVKMEFILLS